MTTKTIVITGATSGIGKEIALQLAKEHATLILGCRDITRGNATADWITKQTGAPLPHVLALDTSSKRSVAKFAAAVKAKHSRLDVLVNNAGINQPAKQTSVDGIEQTFATNVLGYFHLTNELLELLKASGPSRIVNVASTFAGEYDLGDLEFVRRAYTGIKAYKQSKQSNRMLTWALTRRLKGTRVTANAMSPGFVWTGLYRDMNVGSYAFMRTMSLFFGRTPAQGADTAAWLASSPDLEGVTSKFWVKRKELPCAFRDTVNEERLWEKCEAYLERGR